MSTAASTDPSRSPKISGSSPDRATIRCAHLRLLSPWRPWPAPDPATHPPAAPPCSWQRQPAEHMVHSRREDEHYRSILVGVSIDALEGRVRRMDEGLVAILVDDKVNECWDHSIPPDDLGDDQLAKTIAFFVPLARQGLLLGIGRHVPLLPLLGVVDESPDYVGEVGQFLKIADGVPAGRVDPLVGIHGLSLAINAEILSSLEEEVVLLHIDFFQPDRHHKS